jgi:hypothetical protein
MIMAQPKGKTGNPNGRPKGSPNKVTSSVKMWISQLIDDNRAQLEKDIKQLEPKDRILVLEKLMQYVIPKMQTVEAKVDLNDLSDAQIDRIINNINENI